MADSYRTTLHTLLEELPVRKIDALKQIFWTELNYIRQNTSISTRDWDDELISKLVDNPILFATAGENNGFHIIYCRLAHGISLRVERQLVNKFINNQHINSLFIFSDEGQTHWHFVNAKIKRDGSNSAARHVLRRISVGPDNRIRTATERLSLLDVEKMSKGLFGVPIIEIQRCHDEAFDVEAVTNLFFKKYRDFFEQVENSLPLSTEITPEKRRFFTQRFFNRLMFLVFLERKGWLTFQGKTDYLQAIMADYILKDTDHLGGYGFHRSRLNTLFFNTLNNEKGINRVNDPEYRVLREKVGDAPFLNGGLFEAEEGDFQWFFPDTVIIKVLKDLFYAFNFTIAESTPLDMEVAVDPEMLGRIFEELVTGRHETGSYYTPKAVVSFMCRETLTSHLLESCRGETKKAIEKFVEDRDPSGLRNPEAIFQSLRTIKICDPACGSGAYLLGMLHELLDLRAVLFSTCQLDAGTVYERKLEIIQHNLYGVDFDQFAVNIARLRLWLSLVVDDSRNPLQDPHMDVSLPNLDFKIEAGDSLLAPDPSDIQSRGLSSSMIMAFQQAKDAFLTAHASNKKELFAKTMRIKRSIREFSGRDPDSNEFDWIIDFAEVFIPTVIKTTMKGRLESVINSSSGQMELPEPDDSTSTGFDIVLANPPYIRQEMIGQNQVTGYKKTIIANFPDTMSGTADLYVAFYARAHQLLRPGGIACFISSNKWLRANYGEKLCENLLDQQAFQMIVEFGELPVFQTAATFPAIFLWQKKPRASLPTAWLVVKDLQSCYDEGIKEHVNRLAVHVPATQFGKNKPRLANPHTADFRRKMESSGIPLGEYVNNKIYYGIKTGLNKAFIINRKQYDTFIQQDPHNAEILKPLLMGDDVRKYETHYRDIFLIWTYIGVPIKKYPLIFEHLNRFKEQAETRWDKGDHWYELRPCDYYSTFDEPKIIYPDIAKESRFQIDMDNFYIANTGYVIPKVDFFLLGILNSESAWNYLKNTAMVLGDEQKGGRLRVIRQYITKLPIPRSSRIEKENIAKIVRNVFSLHTDRRKAVEMLLTSIGISPAQSNSRNPLEQPWLHTAAELHHRAPRANLATLQKVRDETAAITDEINKIEKEIDQQVAELYGLEG